MKKFQISKTALEEYFNDQIKSITKFSGFKTTQINLYIQDMNEEYIEINCYADISTLLINNEYQLFFNVLQSVFPYYFDDGSDYPMDIDNKGNSYLNFVIRTDDILEKISVINRNSKKIITNFHNDLRIVELNPDEHIILIISREVQTQEERKFLYFATNHDEAIKMFNQEKYTMIREYGLDFQIIKIMDLKSLYVPVEVYFGPIIDREVVANITVNKSGEIVLNYRVNLNSQSIIVEKPYGDVTMDFRLGKNGETELFIKDEISSTFLNNQIKIPEYILDKLLNKLCTLLDIHFKVYNEEGKQNLLYLMDTSELMSNFDYICDIRRKLYTGNGSDCNTFLNKIPEFGPEIINIINILNSSSYNVHVKSRILSRVNNAYQKYNRQIQKRIKRESDPAYIYGNVVTVEEYMDSENGAINVHAYNYGAIYSIPEFKLPQEGKPFYGYSGIRL